MQNKDFKIVFMGTPEFAVTILDGLVESGFNIVSVVTTPDKPAGRGQKLSESAVKQYAVSKNLPVLQPEKLKSEEFLSALKNLQADLFVVVAFRMLPEIVWSMPPKGTINLHGSLLPDYRGAAPINWAIINGEKETGVTTFFIEQEIDTGEILERTSLPILENETAGELHDKLMYLGRQLVIQSVEKIKTGNYKAIKQQEILAGKEPKLAPKIFKNDCLIQWNQPIEKVHDFIRGLSPYPAAWCLLLNETKNETKSYKIIKAIKTNRRVDSSSKIVLEKSGMYIPTQDFYLEIEEIQPEGKKKMNFKEFYAGHYNFTYSISN
jgi:methionyl-tRNA formyltransferase